MTHDELLRLVVYCADTGTFRRCCTTSSNAVSGALMGDENGDGYLRAMVAGRRWLLHRLAFFYVTGKEPELQIDHANGVRSDNRWCNLRAARQAENSQNLAVRKNNAVGLAGVSAKAGKWRAQIRANGRRFHLGTFETPEEASKAYRAAKAQMHKFAPEVRQ